MSHFSKLLFLDADVKGIAVTPNMKSILMIFEYGCLKEYSIDGSNNSTRVVALAEGIFFPIFLIVLDKISHVSFSMDRQTMVFIREDCMVRLFDFKKFTEIASNTELIIGKKF